MTTNTSETGKGHEVTESAEKARTAETSRYSFTDFRDHDARSPWPNGPVVLCLGTSHEMQYALGRGVRAGGAIPVFYDQFENGSRGTENWANLGLGTRPDLLGQTPETTGMVDHRALGQHAAARAAYSAGAVMGIWEHPSELVNTAEWHARTIADEAAKAWDRANQASRPKTAKVKASAPNSQREELVARGITLRNKAAQVVEELDAWQADILAADAVDQ